MFHSHNIYKLAKRAYHCDHPHHHHIITCHACINILVYNNVVCIYMNRESLCGSARQCEWQCVVVRTVVCAHCARQYAAVFLVVYRSAHSSVRLSGSAAVCGSVWQCAAVCGSVCQCCLRQCVTVLAARLCAAVCGSLRQCVVGQYVAVHSEYPYIKVAHDILISMSLHKGWCD
jgi:hypothetical protein